MTSGTDNYGLEQLIQKVNKELAKGSWFYQNAITPRMIVNGIIREHDILRRKEKKKFSETICDDDLVQLSDSMRLRAIEKVLKWYDDSGSICHRPDTIPTHTLAPKQQE